MDFIPFCNENRKFNKPFANGNQSKNQKNGSRNDSRLDALNDWILDAQFLLKCCDHLIVLCLSQVYRLGIGDGKRTAELKTALVLGYDVEMQVRIAVAVRTQIELGAAPQGQQMNTVTYYAGGGSGSFASSYVSSYMTSFMTSFTTSWMTSWYWGSGSYWYTTSGSFGSFTGSGSAMLAGGYGLELI